MRLFPVVIASLATTLAAPIPERSVLDFPVASILRPTPLILPAPDQPIATGRPLPEIFQVLDEGFDSGLLSMLVRDGSKELSLNRTLAEIFGGIFDAPPAPPPSRDDEPPQTDQEIGLLVRDDSKDLNAMNHELAEISGGNAPPATPPTPEEASAPPSGGQDDWAPPPSPDDEPPQTSEPIGGVVNGDVQETGQASEQEIGQGQSEGQDYAEGDGNAYTGVEGNEYSEVPGNEYGTVA